MVLSRVGIEPMAGDRSKTGCSIRGLRGKSALVLVLLVGVVVRSLSFHAALADPLPKGMDGVDYRQLASNVLDRKEFSTWTAGFEAKSTRPPVYPLLVAAAYALSGNRGAVSPGILNFLLDVFSIFLIYLLGRLLAGEIVGLSAAGVYALFGHSPYYAAQTGPHTVSVALVLLLSLALISFRSRYWTVLPGFAILYAILIHLRPVFLLVSPFVLLVVYFSLPRGACATRGEKDGSADPAPDASGVDWRRAGKALLPLLLVAVLCVPWGIRNYREHGMLIPVCTVAGWHLGGTSVYDTQLPVTALMENIYAPEHRGFSEADYYALAKSMFFDALWRHPILLPAFGFARLVVGWAPPGPWWRCFQPKAYVFPLRIGGKFFLPLIDFEGLIYLFIFAVFLGAALSRRRFARVLSRFTRITWPLLVFIAGYALAHIIGFPLPTYRFIIEPPIIVLECVFLMCLATAYAGKRGRRSAFWRALALTRNRVAGTAEISVVYGAAVFFSVLMAVPFLATGNPVEVDYAVAKRASFPEKSYAELRKIQWKHGGGVPKGTVARVAGTAGYFDEGYRHSVDDTFPVKDGDSVAGRLFVEYGSPEHPLGIGDVKVNFKRGNLPGEGEPVIVEGKVSIGRFKWIVIDVDEWKPLRSASGDASRVPRRE